MVALSFSFATSDVGGKMRCLIHSALLLSSLNELYRL